MRHLASPWLYMYKKMTINKQPIRAIEHRTVLPSQSVTFFTLPVFIDFFLLKETALPTKTTAAVISANAIVPNNEGPLTLTN